MTVSDPNFEQNHIKFPVKVDTYHGSEDVYGNEKLNVTHKLNYFNTYFKRNNNILMVL